MAGRRLFHPLTVETGGETLAQQKFSCPACGAEAVWDPAKQALICPFCGTASPAKLDLVLNS